MVEVEHHDALNEGALGEGGEETCLARPAFPDDDGLHE